MKGLTTTLLEARQLYENFFKADLPKTLPYGVALRKVVDKVGRKTVDQWLKESRNNSG